MTDTQEKILLDPVDFMALHLSSLANGGIGGWASFRDGQPWCVRGHALWLEGFEPLLGYDTWGPSMPMADRVGPAEGGLPGRGDRIINAYEARIPFEDYIVKVNADIKEAVDGEG